MPVWPNGLVITVEAGDTIRMLQPDRWMRVLGVSTVGGARVMCSDGQVREYPVDLLRGLRACRNCGHTWSARGDNDMRCLFGTSTWD